MARPLYGNGLAGGAATQSLSAGRSSGAFGQGGQRQIHARLSLKGRLTDHYCAFLEEKARRLSLDISLVRVESGVQVNFSGPEALIGAFEMSAIIGTQDCTVDTWSVSIRSLAD